VPIHIVQPLSIGISPITTDMDADQTIVLVAKMRSRAAREGFWET
jgi:hypothetical protein